MRSLSSGLDKLSNSDYLRLGDEEFRSEINKTDMEKEATSRDLSRVVSFSFSEEKYTGSSGRIRTTRLQNEYVKKKYLT